MTQKPRSSMTIASTMPMLTAPPVIFASARSGML